MDDDSRENRDYVKNAGRSLWQPFRPLSTKQVSLDTTRPACLSDVFGISCRKFEETEVLNELSGKLYKGKKLEFSTKNKLSYESARLMLSKRKALKVIGS